LECTDLEINARLSIIPAEVYKLEMCVFSDCLHNNNIGTENVSLMLPEGH